MLAVLDPALAAPHAGQRQLDMDALVYAITELHSEVKRGVLDLVSDTGILELLASEGLFPLRDHFGGLLATAGLTGQIAGQDLARLVLELLDRAASIEDLVADFEVQSIADNLPEALPPLCECHPHVDAATRRLMLGAIAAGLVDPARSPLFVATARQSSGYWEADIAFRTVLRSPTLEGVDCIPLAVRLPCAASASLAEHAVDPLEVLARARWGASHVRCAISATVKQCGSHATHDWSLHPRFLTTASSPSVLGDPNLPAKVLRACAEIVTDVHLASVHALRADAGPSAKQVTAGGARAWRKDVDREWHIHYWSFGDGHVQLASLNIHKVMTIPDPVIQT